MELEKFNSYSLTIDGFTLTYIFELNLKNLFLKGAMKCDAVLCCRMSPSQKASVCTFLPKPLFKPFFEIFSERYRKTIIFVIN